MEGATTAQIARWAVELAYAQLSPQAIESAKRLLADSFGCALGGARQEEVAIARAHAGELGGAPRCTVIGSALRTDPVTATLLNGLAIRALDYNDIYWRADPVHPSDLVAAALSCAEHRGLGGRELILATVIGYEMEMRLAEMAEPGIREHGWHHATLTAIASPVVAG